MRFTSDSQRKAAFANMMNGPISGMNFIQVRSGFASKFSNKSDDLKKKQKKARDNLSLLDEFTEDEKIDWLRAEYESSKESLQADHKSELKALFEEYDDYGIHAEYAEDRISGKEESDFFGDVISSYTKEDAVRDGQQKVIGTDKGENIYITDTLIGDYDDADKSEELVMRALKSLDIPNDEDTPYMKLRVLEEGKLWVIKSADGITIMHPSDY